MSVSDRDNLNRTFYLLLAVVLLLTFASGAIYGRLTQRWGPTADLVAAADHVRSFPKTLGDWQLQDESTISESVQATLECAGYVNRNYINTKTGQVIGVAVIVGPSGPTAVHTPEICFTSRSFDLKGAATETTAEKSDDTFWKLTFLSRHAGKQELRVYYAWSDGERWIASKNPRVEFGGKPLLYKIQISGDLGLGFENTLEDPAWDFAQALTSSTWKPAVTGLDSE